MQRILILDGLLLLALILFPVWEEYDICFVILFEIVSVTIL